MRLAHFPPGFMSLPIENIQAAYFLQIFLSWKYTSIFIVEIMQTLNRCFNRENCINIESAFYHIICGKTVENALWRIFHRFSSFSVFPPFFRFFQIFLTSFLTYSLIWL
jgi:hypothetical protein